MKKYNFPLASMATLLYPLLAMAYMYTQTPASAVAIAGYGFANLGYLLFAAGIFRGTFKVFGLKERSHVFIVAVVAFIIGFILSNI